MEKKWYNYRPICNRNASSAPLICGKRFFLCYRCTFGVIGAAIANTFLLFFQFQQIGAALLAIICCAMPGTLDYVLTKYNVIKPSNLRRAVTGFLIGIAVAVFIQQVLIVLSQVFASYITAH